MFKLSWRNIGRNRRRAFITIASALFATFFCSVMDSYMDGMWGRMIENALRIQSGHISIHGTGYWEEKTVDHFFAMDQAAIEKLRNLKNVAILSPRLETFALASLGHASKGVAVTGVSPAQENAKSKLETHLVEGRYLTETDDGILLGEGLAKYLKAGVGDTLALLGQGRYGANAAGLFPIRGILRLALPEMNHGIIYATLPSAQQFVDMPDGYSGLLITLKDESKLGESMDEVKQIAGDHEVMSWRFTMKRTLQTAESDKAFTKIILFILYLIVGFGIYGTVIMIANERQREFRTMISLGMSRRRLQAVVALEILTMTFIGLFGGLALTLPVALFFHFHPIKIGGEMGQMFLDMGIEPIIPFSIKSHLFIKQLLIVLILTTVALIHPIRNIRKLKLHN
jgi:ABC-type lipoprotein release transport system permease subunit